MSWLISYDNLIVLKASLNPTKQTKKQQISTNLTNWSKLLTMFRLYIPWKIWTLKKYKNNKLQQNLLKFKPPHILRCIQSTKSLSGTSYRKAFLRNSAGTLVGTSRIACSNYLRDLEYTSSLAHPMKKKSHGLISHDRGGHSRGPLRPSHHPGTGSSLLRKWGTAVM